jgi:hypothetical protein
MTFATTLTGILTIGSNSGGSTRFPGYIGPVSIFPRALSSADIMGLANWWRDSTPYTAPTSASSATDSATGVPALSFYLDYYLPRSFYQDQSVSVTTSQILSYDQKILPGTVKIYDTSGSPVLLATDDGLGSLTASGGSGVTGSVDYSVSTITILYSGTKTMVPQFIPNGPVNTIYLPSYLANFSTRLREFLLNLAIVKHARLFPFVYPRCNIFWNTQVLTDTSSFTVNFNLLAQGLYTTDQSGFPASSDQGYNTDNASISRSTISGYNLVLEHVGASSSFISVPVTPVEATGAEYPANTFYWDIPFTPGYNRFEITNPESGTEAFDFTINAAFTAQAISFQSVQYLRLFITLSS